METLSTQPKKLPKQQRSLVLFDSVVTAATKIFGHTDYQASSTTEIAEKAGVSIGSLYQYFPGKDAIINVIANQITDHHLKSVERRIRAAEKETPGRIDPEKIIDAALDEICSIYFSHRKLLKNLFERANRPEKISTAKQARDKAVALLLATLKQEGVSGLRSAQDLELSLSLLVHGVLGILEASVLDDQTLGQEDRIRSEIQILAKRYILG